MSRLRWEGNLKELRQRLEEYAATNGIAVSSPTPEAELMSQSLPLAHSTTGEALSDICGCGQILSTERVAASRGTSLKADSAEGQLGTAGFVFFYLGPFRYPSTGSGLLFARSLEEDHGDDGVATPFDSGGLIEKFPRADPAEPPREFLSRHELPVPDHREYLGLSLGVLFAKPIDYLEGEEPRWPGPIGLAGGDRRRWTHEVRIPDGVGLQDGHLQAVFVAASRDADPEVDRFLEWCMAEGVDWFPFDALRGDDFEVLTATCVEYLREKLQ
jgi:hypothetical protein